MTKNRFFYTWFVVIASVFFAQSVVAQSLDSDKPVQISADSLEILQPNKTATFNGNVQAVQGGVTLDAAKMTVHYKEATGGAQGAVSRIDATGGVFLATPGETARGSAAVYNLDNKKVVLNGNVVLTRGQNVLKGARLEYSFATGRSIITSAKGTVAADGTSSGGGRVKAIFVPEGK